MTLRNRVIKKAKRLLAKAERLRDEFEAEPPEFQCCLCGKFVNEFGNNPAPLGELPDQCCDECEAGKVLPARFNGVLEIESSDGKFDAPVTRAYAHTHGEKDYVVFEVEWQSPRDGLQLDSVCLKSERLERPIRFLIGWTLDGCPRGIWRFLVNEDGSSPRLRYEMTEEYGEAVVPSINWEWNNETGEMEPKFDIA